MHRWSMPVVFAAGLAVAAGCGTRHHDSAIDSLSGSQTEGETDTDGTDGTDGSTGSTDPSGTETGGETTGGMTTSDSESSSSSAPQAECGNGIVEDGEACDDGNNDNTDDCLNYCEVASCGDGYTHALNEQCDDGNEDESDDCTPECTFAACGDGYLHISEACDDGNLSNEDHCLDTCKIASCGDGFVNLAGDEVCDDTFNTGFYGSCASDCTATMPYCGDGEIDEGEGEQCDTLSPTAEIPCDDTCRYDFTGVEQLYCFGTCTWAGGLGCGQEDADLFCRLLTRNPASTAVQYEVVPAKDQSGLACANPSIIPHNPDDPPDENNQWDDPRIPLPGPMPQYNVWLDQIFFIEYSVEQTHGPNDVLLQPQCTDP